MKKILMCLVMVSSMYVVVGCGEETIQEPPTSPTVREQTSKKGNATGGGKMDPMNPDDPR